MRHRRWILALAASLAVPTAGAATAAEYAPVNCAKAATPTELAICHDYALGQDEARMSTLFGVAMSLVAMGQRGDIGDAQKQWLKTRDACGANVTCLSEAYRRRIGVLGQVMENIASRGPF